MASAIGGLTSRVVRTFDRLDRSASRGVVPAPACAWDRHLRRYPLGPERRRPNACGGTRRGREWPARAVPRSRRRGYVRLDGEEAHLGRGTALAITEPSVRRSARAVRPRTTLLIVGAGRSPFTSTWNPSHFTDIRRPD